MRSTNSSGRRGCASRTRVASCRWTDRLRARMLGSTAADTSAVVEDGQQSVMDLRLKRSPIELNPVVAIGYATVEKRDLTAAVASVSGDQFETKAAPTVTLSGGLQG